MIQAIKALLLADLFELESDPDSLYRKSASELRRLHAENVLLHERHAGDNKILRDIETQRDKLLEALTAVVINNSAANIAAAYAAIYKATKEQQ